MLLCKCIATDFKILIAVKELVELTRLINFSYIRLNATDMKGTFLVRLTIRICTIVITFILSVFQEHFQRYIFILISNRSYVQPAFPQVRCLLSMLAQQRGKGLVVLTQPSRTHLRGCQSNKPVVGFCVPFDRETC